jgi:hypothetical protein
MDTVHEDEAIDNHASTGAPARSSIDSAPRPERERPPESTVPQDPRESLCSQLWQLQTRRDYEFTLPRPDQHAHSSLSGACAICIASIFHLGL